jgi:putative acetyltransferase
MIRSETPEDYAVVYRVNALAFERENEAILVDRLRAAHPHISLVALKDGQVAGHIFFSAVSVESEQEKYIALGLVPMAVLPAYQNQGIGSQLVRRGLRECESQGQNVVFVLGHPHYYPLTTIRHTFATRGEHAPAM